MASILANQELTHRIHDDLIAAGYGPQAMTHAIRQAVAQWAYAMADEMLRAGKAAR